MEAADRLIGIIAPGAGQPPRGLDEHVVRRLPVCRYEQIRESSRKRGADTDCSICIEAYQDSDLLRRLPCLHLFHQECIDRWLGINVRCPICKFEIS